MTTQTAKRPTHRVYAVTEKGGADKAFWTAIGAAWPHRDGRGYSVELSCLPRDNARIVIRMARVRPAPREGKADTRAAPPVYLDWATASDSPQKVAPRHARP